MFVRNCIDKPLEYRKNGELHVLKPHTVTYIDENKVSSKELKEFYGSRIRIISRGYDEDIVVKNEILTDETNPLGIEEPPELGDFGLDKEIDKILDLGINIPDNKPEIKEEDVLNNESIDNILKQIEDEELKSHTDENKPVVKVELVKPEEKALGELKELEKEQLKKAKEVTKVKKASKVKAKSGKPRGRRRKSI